MYTYILSCQRCWWQSCRAFNCKILYGRYLPTVILIIIGIPSPTHSFIPGLKPSFSANLSHHSLSFFSSGLTAWIPQTVYCYFWAYLFLLLSFSVLHFLVVGSMHQIKLTHVGFRAHVKIASRIISYCNSFILLHASSFHVVCYTTNTVVEYQ